MLNETMLIFFTLKIITYLHGEYGTSDYPEKKTPVYVVKYADELKNRCRFSSSSRSKESSLLTRFMKFLIYSVSCIIWYLAS